MNFFIAKILKMFRLYIFKFSFRDLSDNPLVCDCEIAGFLDWAKKVKLGPKSECHEPANLKDIWIKNLRLDMLNCVRPKSNSPPEIEIIPNSNLVIRKKCYVYNIYTYCFNENLLVN